MGKVDKSEQSHRDALLKKEEYELLTERRGLEMFLMRELSLEENNAILDLIGRNPSLNYLTAWWRTNAKA